MYPGAVAQRAPERPAVIMAASGEVITFADLDARSNRLARLLRSRGVERGGRLAIFIENHPRFLEVVWAAQRSGLAYTTINSHLTTEEAAYIINDCGATAVVSSRQLAPVAATLTTALTPNVHTRLLVDGAIPGWDAYEDAVSGQPDGPLADECEGDFVLYSSGTTGQPKGIERTMTFPPMGQGTPGARLLLEALGLVDGDVYLCPAPLYHGAPLSYSVAAQRLGATVVLMERFDALHALALIERRGVTHSQWVPTMFSRMLKLTEEQRHAHDLSSHRAAVHAAAPCPIPVKRAMIEWWGPIVYEYYSATEGVGLTFIDSIEWLAHPGSVGRPMVGEPHILDDGGNELSIGEAGTIWFANGYEFNYHDDPEKTRAARNELGYATVGDVGFLDADGYLYLTDRVSNMVISGGVNIYPQEAENVLVTHPAVFDVAVIGVPNDDLGEEVKAIVQPVDWAAAGPDLAAELIAFTHEHLASYKCPRSVDFDAALPRLDNGKLYKRLLRDRYWPASTASARAPHRTENR